MGAKVEVVAVMVVTLGLVLASAGLRNCGCDSCQLLCGVGENEVKVGPTNQKGLGGREVVHSLGAHAILLWLLPAERTGPPNALG